VYGATQSWEHARNDDYNAMHKQHGMCQANDVLLAGWMSIMLVMVAAKHMLKLLQLLLAPSFSRQNSDVGSLKCR